MSILKHQAVSGIKWSAFSQVARLGMHMLTTIILARLLSASDFGLLGMAMVVIGFVGIFRDLGTSAAVIQQRELTDSLLSSIFWVNVGYGSFAMLTLILLAPLGGFFYHEPRVVTVLQVLSIGFFISSFGVLHQSLLERSLSFGSLARLEIMSIVAGAIIGIGSALLKAGVWSLVFQSLTTALFTTILLWSSSRWRPRAIFHWKEIKTVSRFTLNLTGFNIFNYFARNADYLLIGRYLGVQDLGYYTLAYRILLFPLQNISAVIGRVMYPVLSTMQDDNKRFASAYLKMVGSIAFISFPLMMGVLALTKPFVFSFFGEKWQPVIVLIMILTPVGLIQSIGTTVGGIYQVRGRTDWMFRWGIGAGTLVVAAFVIGLQWGIIGVAVGYTVTSLILLYPGFSIPFRLIDLPFISMLKVLKPSFLNSGLMFMVLLIFRTILPASLSDVSALAFSVMIGVATYGLASWLANREQLNELWGLILNKRKLREEG